MPDTTADEDDPKPVAREGAVDRYDKLPIVRRRGRTAKILRLAATGVILLVAGVAAAYVWAFYVVAPWTRDGTVRVQVANIAPQVAGQIIEVRVRDNQNVRKGDVLYVIDPIDFEVSVTSADAEVKNREADLQVKNAQSARRQALTTVSTSIEEKQQYAGTAKIAEATLESAQAQLRQAKVNLERTQVRSTVNGRVTNLLMRVGDYARTGTSNISVVDTDSFWIDGYFEETKMPNIHVGDAADVKLMGFDPHLTGTVESITLGISTANAAASTQGLPDVNPVYTWVRLAQRVPVRIKIDHVPPEVPLIAGMTATVVVNGGRAPTPNWFMDLSARVSALTNSAHGPIKEADRR
ncbi:MULTISPECIES: efflux RND transporter periplasmic adaptor subunit [Methylobacterium]|uniref:HlyD family secretion protein n=1 Tax=Methylobacterium longum TaxID=767694 RepID=A0ABT8ALW9_9HYPH|nr:MULTISPECIES: HlyD family secretion protein [Methylobacterium]MCJ2101729.1 HlyD family secretion protein [Methylobacterium sp. E-046]MDN3570566.1 HlyD family secretion protein [Methylobacterium longum]GJE09710.1 p-hydroxybenzoic acid efflux pump subunit AaeA [Methylobacterium longum]